MIELLLSLTLTSGPIFVAGIERNESIRIFSDQQQAVEFANRKGGYWVKNEQDGQYIVVYKTSSIMSDIEQQL